MEAFTNKLSGFLVNAKAKLCKNATKFFVKNLVVDCEFVSFFSILTRLNIGVLKLLS